MEELRVPTVATPKTALQVIQGFNLLWLEFKQTPPTKACLLVLTAHSALETGHWKLMFQNNLGNAKANVNTQKYCFQPTTEILDPETAKRLLASAKPREGDASLLDCVLVRVNPPVVDPETGKVARGEKWTLRFFPTNAVAAFRAFDTFEEGARDHFKFLMQDRFAKALAAAERGDAAGYVNELFAQRYFTQFLEPYRKGVVGLYGEKSRELKDFEPILSLPEPEQQLVVTPFSLQSVTWSEIEKESRDHGLEDDGGQEGVSEEVGSGGGEDQGGES